jgi:hypothetical protein
MIGEIYLLHRSWLDKSIDLLLKACILPMTRARSAWAVGSRARLVKKKSGQVIIDKSGSHRLLRIRPK